jgi:hypothetical protein
MTTDSSRFVELHVAPTSLHVALSTTLVSSASRGPNVFRIDNSARSRTDLLGHVLIGLDQIDSFDCKISNKKLLSYFKLWKCLAREI